MREEDNILINMWIGSIFTGYCILSKEFGDMFDDITTKTKELNEVYSTSLSVEQKRKEHTQEAQTSMLTNLPNLLYCNLQKVNLIINWTDNKRRSGNINTKI